MRPIGASVGRFPQAEIRPDIDHVHVRRIDRDRVARNVHGQAEAGPCNRAADARAAEDIGRAAASEDDINRRVVAGLEDEVADVAVGHRAAGVEIGPGRAAVGGHLKRAAVAADRIGLAGRARRERHRYRDLSEARTVTRPRRRGAEKVAASIDGSRRPRDEDVLVVGGLFEASDERRVRAVEAARRGCEPTAVRSLEDVQCLARRGPVRQRHGRRDCAIRAIAANDEVPRVRARVFGSAVILRSRECEAVGTRMDRAIVIGRDREPAIVRREIGVVGGAVNAAIVADDEPRAGIGKRMLVGMNLGALHAGVVMAGELRPGGAIEALDADRADVNRIGVGRIGEQRKVIPALRAGADRGGELRPCRRGRPGIGRLPGAEQAAVGADAVEGVLHRDEDGVRIGRGDGDGDAADARAECVPRAAQFAPSGAAVG